MTKTREVLTDKEFREKIMEAALADAEAKAYDAGMNGSWNDNGASQIKETVLVWKCGLEGIIPPLLYKYHDKVLQDEDPEYAEFVRLSKKFNKETP